MKKIVANLRNNYLFLILFLFSIVNMLYMHYHFLFTIGIDFYFSKTSVLDNFMAVLLDVTVIYVFSLLLCWGRVKYSLTVTFFITLILSFSNILYSRFFSQYLSLSAILQADNLNDNVVIQSVLSGFEIYDCLFLLFALLYVLILFVCQRQLIKAGYIRILGAIWAIVLLLIFACHSIYLINGSFERAVQTLVPSYSESSDLPNWENVYPNWATFHKGLFRTLIVDNLFVGGSKIVLSSSQLETINSEYRNYEKRVTNKTHDPSVQNVIFILVESYLAVLSDLRIDGKEITPYLNALKRDSNVYYNGHVAPNAKIGRSSDGQLIYMTGLLPLRSEISVSCAKNDSLVSLPDILLKQEIVKKTQILVPTSPALWEQTPMNKVYNFETMLSKMDYKLNQNGDDLVDEVVFEFAKQLDSQMYFNSFTLILTLSMHEPYDECVEDGFHLEDYSLPNRYRNYLIACHYFDKHIGRYLEHLKDVGLYDQSLIVIVSDHEPHLKNMDMEGKINDELPLYIINGGFDKSKVWTGPCNQLDVYTTLLDIIGVESEWRGLGHTLLNPDYSNSVTDKTWQISDWIIRGDYFRQNK